MNRIVIRPLRERVLCVDQSCCSGGQFACSGREPVGRTCAPSRRSAEERVVSIIEDGSFSCTAKIVTHDTKSHLFGHCIRTSRQSIYRIFRCAFHKSQFVDSTTKRRHVESCYSRKNEIYKCFTQRKCKSLIGHVKLKYFVEFQFSGFRIFSNYIILNYLN